jgi:hypothetical protein
MIGIVSVWNPQKNWIIGFQNIISVLLHYSVSIAAAAAKAEYIPLLATAVYIPQSYSSVSGFYII